MNSEKDHQKLLMQELLTAQGTITYPMLPASKFVCPPLAIITILFLLLLMWLALRPWVLVGDPINLRKSFILLKKGLILNHKHSILDGGSISYNIYYLAEKARKEGNPWTIYSFIIRKNMEILHGSRSEI